MFSLKTTAGHNYISPIYIDNVSSEPLIAIAVPVKNVFGDLQGTLVAEVNLKFMWDLVGHLQVGTTGYAYVVDNKGNLIALGDSSRVLRGENVKQILPVQEFIKNLAAPTPKTPDLQAIPVCSERTVVGTYVSLGTPQWAVVTELPSAEANQSVIGLLLSSSSP